jgi:hypothetical protein
MNWEQAFTRAIDSSAQHALYFLIGWIGSTMMWLTFLAGFALGIFYHKKKGAANVSKRSASQGDE